MTTLNDSLDWGAEDTGPGTVFRELASLVYAGDDYSQIHQAICDAAVRLVDCCEHASIMVLNDDNVHTSAATDEVARRVDELERLVGEGPCLDAIHEESVQLDADLTVASTWPRLRERVLEETPVRGLAGFRLVVDDRKVGALNLFCDDPRSLTEGAIDQAAVLAAFASVVFIAASNQEQALTLREGLASNREIGKAIGLMMAFHKVDDAQAFEILRKASQDMNLKLRDVAGQVVDHHNKGAST